jgi:hypothetical protein
MAEGNPPLLEVLRPDHKEGRHSDSPCPWKANGKRFAFTHWHLMDIGGSECRASDSEPAQIAKRTPHGRRQSAAPCCFRFENRHGGELICQDLRLGDFETRVRSVPSQSPMPDQPLLA